MNRKFVKKLTAKPAAIAAPLAKPSKPAPKKKASTIELADELVSSYSNTPFTLKADGAIFDYGIADLPNPDYEPPLKKVVGMKVTWLTSQEIVDMATVVIKTSKTSGPGSVYDPGFGVITNFQLCPICGLDWKSCPGHPGVIIFPYPLPHPICLKEIALYLTCVCEFCHRLVITWKQMKILGILKYQGENRFKAYLDVAKKIVRCKSCKRPHGKYSVVDDKFFKAYKKKGEVKKIPIPYDEVVEIIMNIREKEFQSIGFPDPLCHPKHLIISNLSVLSVCGRPYVESNNTQCFPAGTMVSLTDGTAVPIESMKFTCSRVLSWGENGGFGEDWQTHLYDQGEKECITLTLEDGRQITCTPDHKFQTVNGEWIEAQDLTLGKTQLRCGLDNARCPTEISEYHLRVGNFDLSMADPLARMKALALCRIIGYVITDGCRNESVIMGHELDAKSIIDDIELLSGNRPRTRINGCLRVNIPIFISKNISVILPVQKGERVNHPMILPEFMFDISCPTSLIREVLGGMFGGNGIVPRLEERTGRNTDSMGRLGFFQSKHENHLPSLVSALERLRDLLAGRFGVHMDISNLREYDKDKRHYRVELQTDRCEDILTFIEQVGFRHCIHKQLRTCAVACFLRYRAGIIRQNQWIFDRSKALVNTSNHSELTLKDAVEVAKAELLAREVFISPDHVLSYDAIKFNKWNSHEGISSSREFFERTLLSPWIYEKYSLPRGIWDIPGFSLRVIDRRPCGIKNVYDITVNRSHNMLCEGISASNCNDDLTHKYNEIYKVVVKLSEKGLTDKSKMDYMDTLMFHVKTMMDNGKNKARDPNGKRCLVYDTPLALSSGIALPIGSLKNYTSSHVLAWSDKEQGIIKAQMEGFYDQGELDCMELMFGDGRKIVCTPDHRFLSTDDKWIEAKDIVLGETRIRMGVEYPSCPDILEDKTTYILRVGKLSFDLAISLERFKALALCRIMGYILIDGSQQKDISFGHHEDANVCLDDIYLLTGKRPKMSYNSGKLWKLVLPSELSGNIFSIQKEGCILPEFISDVSCPRMLVREFLAGMFGRDSIVPGLSATLGISPILLVCSKSQEHSLIEALLNLFEVDARVYSPQSYDDKSYVSIGERQDMIKFIERVGFRYSSYRAVRATVMLTCFRFLENTPHQSSVDLKKFIRTNNLLDLFNDFSAVDRGATSLPTFSMTVIRCQPCGKKACYDISVEAPFNCFVANGAVAHNSLKAIKQRMSGKSGYFRQNIQGKRTIQCGRSVISPNPDLHVSEVGMPRKIADKLTYPVRVNAINMVACQQLLENDRVIRILRGENAIDGKRALFTRGFKLIYGDIVLRGDKRIIPAQNFKIELGDQVLRIEQTELEDGTIEVKRKLIQNIEPSKRKFFKLLLGDILERKLQNGDIGAFNRQPSLHEPSFRGKRIRIHDDDTFQMDLSSTGGYGAD